MWSVLFNTVAFTIIFKKKKMLDSPFIYYPINYLLFLGILPSSILSGQFSCTFQEDALCPVWKTNNFTPFFRVCSAFSHPEPAKHRKHRNTFSLVLCRSLLGKTFGAGWSPALPQIDSVEQSVNEQYNFPVARANF